MQYQVYSPILDKYGLPVLGALAVLLVVMELRRPLRRRVQGLVGRQATNAAVSVPAFLVMRLGLIPAELAAAYWARDHGFGLLNVFAMPGWLHGVLSFLFMDYLLYVWHVLTHRVPLLWRFHNVHHTDLDMSVSTGIRFHFGEMLLSGGFRGLGVLLAGTGPIAVLVYEVAFEAGVAFQHSNWKLPVRVERALTWVIITPRTHGIHHSMVTDERNSNYTNLLNVWDRLHGTMRLDVPQARVTIGVPNYRDEHELHLFGLLMLPFRRQRDDHAAPGARRSSGETSGDRLRLEA